MSSLFRDILKPDLHSLENVRQELNSALETDIEFIALMKRHHDFLEESIDVILSKTASEPEKQAHLLRFFRLLEMHGKAEEEVLYPELRASDIREARIAGLSGKDEHDVVFQIEKELTEMDYRNSWSEVIEAHAKVVAGLVHHHIREEENEAFKIADRVIPDSTHQSMKLLYISKCLTYLDQF